MKANSNPEILKRIAASGIGADTVSLGEIRAAIAAGFPAAKIVFAGVGKTDEEIAAAIEYEIGCFNAESDEEVGVIEEIAKSLGKKSPCGSSHKSGNRRPHSPLHNHRPCRE